MQDTDKLPDDLLYELDQIDDLLKKIPHYRCFREIAIYAQPLDAETFAALRDTLQYPCDRHWRQRIVLSWVLGRATLTPEQAEEATKVLSEVLNDRQIPPARRTLSQLTRATYHSILWMGILLLVGAIGAPLIYSAIGARLIYGAGWLATPVLFIASYVAVTENVLTVRRYAVQALGRIGLPESIAALAEAKRESSSTTLGSIVDISLMAVLPHLTSDHYGKLNIEMVSGLCQLLIIEENSGQRTANHTHTMLRILEALEKIGGSRAVTIVKHLAEKSRTPEVRTTAQRVLPTLLERQEQENHYSTLLRGAASPEASSQLLRAGYHSGTDTAPAELLRAVQEQGQP